MKKVVIIGAGIVGSALAAYLSRRDQYNITLIDYSLDELTGSTGHAPGYIGQFNEYKFLTQLAKASVEAYEQIDHGFIRCGALEVATTDEGLRLLQKRAALAAEQGLRAKVVSANEALSLAPLLMPKTSVRGALHFPDDGAASAIDITKNFRQEAISQGATLLEAKCTGLITTLRNSERHVTAIKTAHGSCLQCDIAIFATGIWSGIQDFATDLAPIIPVAHPYLHSPRHAPREFTMPFVRIPEEHIYLRDHGIFDGLGSYAHEPIELRAADLETAIGPENSKMTDAIHDAINQLRHPHLFGDTSAKCFDGVFALTPDNLPVVGAVPGIQGLFIAAAIWVTHAAGCAQLLVSMIEGDRDVDVHMVNALHPGRFRGEKREVLVQKALRQYNDIYTSGSTKVHEQMD